MALRRQRRQSDEPTSKRQRGPNGHRFQSFVERVASLSINPALRTDFLEKVLAPDFTAFSDDAESGQSDTSCLEVRVEGDSVSVVPTDSSSFHPPAPDEAESDSSREVGSQWNNKKYRRGVVERLRSTWFVAALRYWRGRNRSADFVRLQNSVSIDGGLPELLLKLDSIIDYLLQEIELPTSLAKEPAYHLIAVLVKDVSSDIQPFLPRVIRTLIRALDVTDPQSLEGTFHCIATLFRDLSSALLAKLPTLLSLYKPLLLHKKNLVRLFAAESISFLFRKCNDKEIARAVATLRDLLQGSGIEERAMSDEEGDSESSESSTSSVSSKSLPSSCSEGSSVSSDDEGEGIEAPRVKVCSEDSSEAGALSILSESVGAIFFEMIKNVSNTFTVNLSNVWRCLIVELRKSGTHNIHLPPPPLLIAFLTFVKRCRSHCESLESGPAVELVGLLGSFFEEEVNVEISLNSRPQSSEFSVSLLAAFQGVQSWCAARPRPHIGSGAHFIKLINLQIENYLKIFNAPSSSPQRDVELVSLVASGLARLYASDPKLMRDALFSVRKVEEKGQKTTSFNVIVEQLVNKFEISNDEASRELSALSCFRFIPLLELIVEQTPSSVSEIHSFLENMVKFSSQVKVGSYTSDLWPNLSFKFPTFLVRWRNVCSERELPTLIASISFDVFLNRWIEQLLSSTNEEVFDCVIAWLRILTEGCKLPTLLPELISFFCENVQKAVKALQLSGNGLKSFEGLALTLPLLPSDSLTLKSISKLFALNSSDASDLILAILPFWEQLLDATHCQSESEASQWELYAWIRVLVKLVTVCVDSQKFVVCSNVDQLTSRVEDVVVRTLLHPDRETRLAVLNTFFRPFKGVGSSVGEAFRHLSALESSANTFDVQGVKLLAITSLGHLGSVEGLLPIFIRRAIVNVLLSQLWEKFKPLWLPSVEAVGTILSRLADPHEILNSTWNELDNLIALTKTDRLEVARSKAPLARRKKEGAEVAAGRRFGGASAHASESDLFSIEERSDRSSLNSDFAVRITDRRTRHEHLSLVRSKFPYSARREETVIAWAVSIVEVYCGRGEVPLGRFDRSAFLLDSLQTVIDWREKGPKSKIEGKEWSSLVFLCSQSCLSIPNEKVQKLCLKILKFDSKFKAVLFQFENEIEKIVQNIDFVSQLQTFSDLKNCEHRRPFVQLIVPVLFSKLLARKGKSSTSAEHSRRRAVFRFVNALNATEVAYFLTTLFAAVFDHDEVGSFQATHQLFLDAAEGREPQAVWIEEPAEASLFRFRCFELADGKTEVCFPKTPNPAKLLGLLRSLHDLVTQTRIAATKPRNVLANFLLGIIARIGPKLLPGNVDVDLPPRQQCRSLMKLAFRVLTQFILRHPDPLVLWNDQLRHISSFVKILVERDVLAQQVSSATRFVSDLASESFLLPLFEGRFRDILKVLFSSLSTSRPEPSSPPQIGSSKRPRKKGKSMIETVLDLALQLTAGTENLNEFRRPLRPSRSNMRRRARRRQRSSSSSEESNDKETQVELHLDGMKEENWRERGRSLLAEFGDELMKGLEKLLETKNSSEKELQILIELSTLVPSSPQSVKVLALTLKDIFNKKFCRSDKGKQHVRLVMEALKKLLLSLERGRESVEDCLVIVKDICENLFKSGLTEPNLRSSLSDIYLLVALQRSNCQKINEMFEKLSTDIIPHKEAAEGFEWHLWTIENAIQNEWVSLDTPVPLIWDLLAAFVVKALNAMKPRSATASLDVDLQSLVLSEFQNDKTLLEQAPASFQKTVLLQTFWLLEGGSSEAGSRRLALEFVDSTVARIIKMGSFIKELMTNVDNQIDSLNVDEKVRNEYNHSSLLFRAIFNHGMTITRRLLNNSDPSRVRSGLQLLQSFVTNFGPILQWLPDPFNPESQSFFERCKNEKIGIDPHRIELLTNRFHLDLSKINLLSSEPPTPDLFNELLHPQRHRNARAMQLLADACSRKLLTRSTASFVCIPLALRGTLQENAHSVGEVLHQGLMSHSVACLAAAAPLAGWAVGCRRVVLILLRSAKKNPKRETLLIRAISSVVKSFEGVAADAAQQLLANLEQKTDHENENSHDAKIPHSDSSDLSSDDAKDGDGANNGSRVVSASVGVSNTSAESLIRLQHSISSELIPSLRSFLCRNHKESLDKKSAGRVIRPEVVMVIVQLARFLPLSKFDLEIPKLLSVIGTALANRDATLRRKARAAFVGISKALGPAHFANLVSKIGNYLTKGYQVAVLLFTATAALDALLTSSDEKCIAGSLDSAMPQLLALIPTELDRLADPDRPEFAAFRGAFDGEGGAGSKRAGIDEQRYFRSGHLVRLLSSIASPNALRQLLEFLRGLLTGETAGSLRVGASSAATAFGPKFRNLVRALFQEAVLGCLKNEELPESVLLEEATRLLENHPTHAQPPIQKPHPLKRSLERLLVQPGAATGRSAEQTIKKRGAGVNSAATNEILGRTGLRLLSNALARADPGSFERSLLARAASRTVDLFCGSGGELVSLAGGCLLKLLPLELPELQQRGAEVARTILKLFQSSGSGSSQEAIERSRNALGACTRLLAALLETENDDSWLPSLEGDKAFRSALLAQIRFGLTTASQRGAALELFRKAILPRARGREPSSIEDASLIYGIASDAAQLLLQKSTDTRLSKLCIGVYGEFLLDFPMTVKVQEKHFSWIVSNLEFDRLEGRRAMLALLHYLLSRVPPEVLRERYAALVLLALTLRLVNETDPETLSQCRAMLLYLFERVSDESCRQSLLETASVAFLGQGGPSEEAFATLLNVIFPLYVSRPPRAAATVLSLLAKAADAQSQPVDPLIDCISLLFEQGSIDLLKHALSLPSLVNLWQASFSRLSSPSCAGCSTLRLLKVFLLRLSSASRERGLLQALLAEDDCDNVGKLSAPKTLNALTAATREEAFESVTRSWGREPAALLLTDILLLIQAQLQLRNAIPDILDREEKAGLARAAFPELAREASLRWLMGRLSGSIRLGLGNVGQHAVRVWTGLLLLVRIVLWLPPSLALTLVPRRKVDSIEQGVTTTNESNGPRSFLRCLLEPLCLSSAVSKEGREARSLLVPSEKSNPILMVEVGDVSSFDTLSSKTVSPNLKMRIIAAGASHALNQIEERYKKNGFSKEFINTLSDIQKAIARKKQKRKIEIRQLRVKNPAKYLSRKLKKF